MLPKMFVTSVLALIASSVVVNAASAQGFPWSRQGEYLYRQTEQYQRFNAQPATVVPFANADANRSLYPAVDQRVRLHVVVPADAKITFDGNKTLQNGTHRDFESPALDMGQRYSYEIQATWTENGKQVTQKRVVPVFAGDDVQIRITRDSVRVDPAR